MSERTTATTVAATVADLAALVRSKNAGPFWLTIDLMFRDADGYRRACAAPALQTANLARLLKVEIDHVIVARMEAVHAIKVSVPRQASAGSPRDNDSLGGQQYAALLGLPIE